MNSMDINPQTLYPANQDGIPPDTLILNSTTRWIAVKIQEGVESGEIESEEAGIAMVESLLRFFLDPDNQPQ